MNKIFILLTTIFLLMNGCVSLNTVSLTQIPKQRSRVVKASVDRTIILGLNFDNDYVDQLSDKLKAQCKNGVVTGILTKDQTTNYFLFLVYNREVVARGYCVKS